ncbi:RNA polymerase sigma factor [Paenibacillus alvei]|uniref:RNA polymerase sigma factor n=1 Tax=Paenibacillus alvei TaxID=44250 RepID=UPI0013D97328|nr:sigma-70 family RNA polymerase sigma factor [Paenibacillus alvei]NEZ42607.1 sigma-70 family RNA polymerase sigma factor [Paenibacillus alvei]
MIEINLKDVYSFYKTDVWVEVDEEIVHEMRRFDNLDSAYKLRAYRHRAYYSLDGNDGLEHQILFPMLSSEEKYEEAWLRQEIYKAMCQLSEKTFRRIYAHYFLGLSKVAIAQAEKVDERAVRKSISSGLKKLARLLDKVQL